MITTSDPEIVHIVKKHVANKSRQERNKLVNIYIDRIRFNDFDTPEQLAAAKEFVSVLAQMLLGR